MNDTGDNNLVSIHNCRNVDLAEFRIEPNKLNIKYAPNGTGKSSIADGIRLAITDDQALATAVVPFKHRDDSDAFPFAATGLDQFHTVEIFNEDYVKDVAFIANGIFANSFDVFIKTPEYNQTLERINELLAGVLREASKEAILNMASSLNVLAQNIGGNSGLTSSNALRGNSPAKKGLANGNPKKGIPAAYQPFYRYIESERLGKWAKWHASGEALFEDEDDRCPFCGQEIGDLRNVINGLKDQYSSSNADNLDKMVMGITAAHEYFNEETRDCLEEIVNSTQAITESQTNYLAEIVQQATLISNSIQKSSGLTSYFKLSAAGENIEELIKECRVDFGLMSHFDSSVCNGIVEKYNNVIDELCIESRKLLGIVNAQKTKLAQAIAGYQEEIDSFFKNAGYPYTIRIDLSPEGDCSVKLVHESTFVVDDANGVLSYGERNALALVFFMYSALGNNPDLIILDDPITSFDGHKRFAILHMLFLKDEDAPNSLKNKTTLLLTHEFEVVFDIEHTLKSEFQPLAKTTLLHISKGTISETVIDKSDMKPVRDLFGELATNSDNLLIRLAYARRLSEIDGNRGSEWDILSSLFHHRSEPLTTDGDAITGETLETATNTISAMIDADFDYYDILAQVNDPNFVLDLFESSPCNYEKLQVARIALDGEEDRVTKKLLDETLHVDIGFTFQLDPRRFELVPDSVIEQCREALDRKYSNR